ncbi:hypothetical protein AMS68_005235 [Peltaster fructicola]|uniref:Scavenger mRNA decapping enzyme n=1 Tax=Peltaster fructicola TaxID=286661 RepID=A0A6H0XYP4_9PEZI|nr:hypothetical protein AMS68_005235 [Peltaster fructicola]
MTAETLIKDFKYQSLLNQDQGGRRIILQGSINDKPALLLVERAAFSTEHIYLDNFSRLVSNINNLGDNDIYKWYMANTLSDGTTISPPDLKLNLIYPCKDSHIKKYSFQQSRSVVETPEIYQKYVRPYMSKCREEGRLNWVFNILEGRTEQENVLYRSAQTGNVEDEYILLPDLNWDRTTIGSLHLLALVQRRDIWSVRDLRKKHVAWLRSLRRTLTDTVEKLYPGVESDMLKLYLHYQPTYYHLHIHIVHVSLDATGTQATGKALGLDNVISQLETMSGGADAGMADVELAFTLGEASELWSTIFLPLKKGEQPAIA